ncbi:unnamed protein product [Clonostachys rosea f. rosea IK726]|uniref:Uncharacterized protein n=1 Tax=Clonostachys rosea f. rosea IK726 TaxID=1349383 RepID=A0ACA9UQB5_BIOOC|nr:unnamed protein product [Clonostachys rosea f. rosea IK726]
MSQPPPKKGPLEVVLEAALTAVACCVLTPLVLPILAVKGANSWRKQWLKKREKERSQREIKRKCFQSRDRPRTKKSSEGTGPLFTRIPPEIRRRILIQAFGERTLHLDLAFIRGGGSSAKWRWYSCICHSDQPGLHHAGRLARGRTPCGYHGSPYERDQRNPLACPRSDPTLSAHAGPCPDNCRVGASGWLLTCRQANLEGLEVLYGTNTIHIDTRILLLGLHEILSPEKLRLMKDLEINVSGILDVASYFKGLSNETPPENVSVLFPSLRRLRLIVAGMEYIPQEEVDKLVQRILLPGTEVIVSRDDGLHWHDEGNIEYSDLLSFIHSRWLSPIATRA